MIDKSVRACLEAAIDIDLEEPNLDIALCRAVESFKDRALGMENSDGSYVTLSDWQLRLDSVVAYFSFNDKVGYVYTFKPERR